VSVSRCESPGLAWSLGFSRKRRDRVPRFCLPQRGDAGRAACNLCHNRNSAKKAEERVGLAEPNAHGPKTARREILAVNSRRLPIRLFSYGCSMFIAGFIAVLVNVLIHVDCVNVIAGLVVGLGSLSIMFSALLSEDFRAWTHCSQ
jgi:hypothetical protein